MKKVSEELRYDGATIEQVHEMLADPAFREQVCESQGYIRHTVQIERDGQGMTVSIDQIQAAHGIPGFAKKFVGDEIHIVQTEDWTSPEKGNIHVTIPGKPGEMSGTGPAHRGPRRHHRDRQPRPSRSTSRSSAARSRASSPTCSARPSAPSTGSASTGSRTLLARRPGILCSSG